MLNDARRSREGGSDQGRDTGGPPVIAIYYYLNNVKVATSFPIIESPEGKETTGQWTLGLLCNLGSVY